MRRRWWKPFSLAIGPLALALVFSASLAQASEPNIYPDQPNAKPEIQAALTKARHEHKRVLLDFGGNWCGDCRVLNYYFHQQPNDRILGANFVVVPVNVGHYDMNTDVADTYGVPIKKGVPELVVLSAEGKVLNGMTMSQFEKMRSMQASTVTDFLNQWAVRK